MQPYSKQREKSHLVKHYHQEEIKRLQKKLSQIKHRKKGLFPQNKQNSLPTLSPRYILPLTRQFQIQDENNRLSARIAEMKIKDSQYFKKILKQKERVKTLINNGKNKQQCQRVKLIYSGPACSFLEERSFQGSKSGVRAVTQRVRKVEAEAIL